VTSSRTEQRWVLYLTSACALMVALDQLVVATALTTMQRSLHCSLATLEWTVNAYSLSFAVLLMTAAALGDRWGRRRVLVWGLVVFTASSAAAGLAPSVGWLIAARAVQGAGSAAVMPLAMAILTATVPPQRRGRALGIFSALTGLAVVGGPLLGGVVTEGLAWQWIFWLNVPIGAVVIPLVVLRTSESHGTPRPLDVVGVVLSAIGALGLSWALVRSGDAGWGSSEVLTALAVGLIGLVAFVRWELRAASPALPMRFFRTSAFAAGNLSAFLLYSSLMGTVFLVSQYLQVVFRYGPVGAGLRLLPWTAVLFVSAPLSGMLADRLGPRRLVSTGLLLQAVGFSWLAVASDHHWGYATWAGALLCAGSGATMAMPAVQSAVLGAVPPAAVGQASGTLNTLRQLGAVFGVSLLALVLRSHGGGFANGISAALAVAAVLSLLGAAAGLGVPGKARPSVEPAAQPVPVAASA
jgi:EmrB/QacA subfamily drug resistance transporter